MYLFRHISPEIDMNCKNLIDNLFTVWYNNYTIMYD